MTKNEEIVSLLMADVKGELQAVMQYLQSSFVTKGLYRDTVVDVFKDIAEEEMRHIWILGKRIVAYGGVPDLTALSPVTLDPSINENFTLGKLLEQNTIAQYAAHRDRFHELGEHGLVQTIEGIMQDEEAHLTKIILNTIEK